jgi:signal peptidase I
MKKIKIMREFFTSALEIIKTAILALLIVLPIRYFLFQPFLVQGASMEPNFSSGDYLIVDEISYRFRLPQRGETIVFYYPQNRNQRFIKRIIALPKETVYIYGSEVYVKTLDNKILDFSGLKYSPNIVIKEDEKLKEILEKESLKINLKEDEYFVMGDNRLHSYDSRSWGPVSKKDIIGRVILRLWPINNITYFSSKLVY